MVDAIPSAGIGQNRETEFVQGAAKSSDGIKAMRNAATTAAGVPLSTRVDPDVAAALKRASLERKLHGIEPNSLRDIMEEALAPWLRAHGYLP
ncbi:MAG: hypothetical protein JNG88_09275 [Phycisphaerales bacterium]|nr:hypothetical protein [Phycisphaerales bacterium]